MLRLIAVFFGGIVLVRVAETNAAPRDARLTVWVHHERFNAHVETKEPRSRNGCASHDWLIGPTLPHQRIFHIRQSRESRDQTVSSLSRALVNRRKMAREVNAAASL